jgi:hypothetical protein
MAEHFPRQTSTRKRTIPSYEVDVLYPSHVYPVLKQADTMFFSCKNIVASLHVLRALLFVRLTCSQCEFII